MDSVCSVQVGTVMNGGAANSRHGQDERVRRAPKYADVSPLFFQ